MKVDIKVFKTFMHEAKRLNKRYASFADDYQALISEITKNPMIGTDLGNGVRKIRMRIKSKGKGKSGGARVISLNIIVAASETKVNLLYIYDKTERSSISADEIKALLKKNELF